MAINVIFSSFRLWWDETWMLMAFNFLWFLLQIPIVTGPPATAAMYAIARRIADEGIVEFHHGVEAFRQTFLAAWKWGAINLIIIVVVATNFLVYQNVPGTGWAIIRTIWAVVTLVWLLLNQFYWPLWLVQENRSMRNTLSNCMVILARYPGMTISLAIICAILIAASILLILPLLIFLMSWLALIETVAVKDVIQRLKHMPET